ncbi:M64 family metallopeptidase [uncultured Phenylobacterium sp.]|uniref:M64 family metallopeptidase n=1 Tax=uncultured Phenylobacterium sp. TaxID=349273 RepID=UPI0025DD0806|nr:M64 family metallopeptidase [uncultured Phenylobacterium sp.]
MRETVAAALPEYDAILVLVNGALRGGAGGTIAWLSVASGDWKEVAVHEMGHAVFGLADEYDYYSTAAEAGHDNYVDGEPGEPNVTIQPDPAMVKWSALVTAAATSPTMNNANCGNPNNAPSPVGNGIVGTFEGARYFHCDIYRPEYACMMRTTGSPFCAVCRQTIRNFFAPFAAPSPTTGITLDTPSLDYADTPVGTTALRAATFSVEACVPVTFEVIAAPGLPFAVHGAALVTSLPAGGPVRKARVFFSYGCTAIGTFANDTATIRCLETGQVFVVPLSGNCVRRPTVAVQLVLDRSGSMVDAVPGFGDKANLLRFAANVLVDLLYPDTGIGLNAFDQDPHPLMDVQLAGAAGIGAGRLAARVQIGGYAPNPFGGTAIGDGIELGKQKLDAAGFFDAKAMIVLTDGIETASKRVSEVAAGVIGQRVFGIGLGTADGVQPSTLEALASNTGGYLLMTGAVTEATAFELAKYYLQILAGVTNNDIVLDPEGTAHPGQVVRIPFDIVDEDIEVTAVVIAQLPRALRMALESPNGDLFTEADAATDPTISFAYGESTVHLRASLPMQKAGQPSHGGRWHLLMVLDKPGRFVTGGQLSSAAAAFAGAAFGGLRYSASILAYSNVKLAARLTQDSLEPGATLTVTATLTQSSLPFEGFAHLSAEITRPDGSLTTAPMTQSEAGRWELLHPATAPGVYRFRVLALGRTIHIPAAGRPIRSGQRFTREQIVTGAVWRGGDRPSDPGGDPDGGRDPVVDLLCCLFSHGGLRPEALKRLEALGVDTEHLRKCIDDLCRQQKKPPG